MANLKKIVFRSCLKYNGLIRRLINTKLAHVFSTDYMTNMFENGLDLGQVHQETVRLITVKKLLRPCRHSGGLNYQLMAIKLAPMLSTDNIMDKVEKRKNLVIIITTNYISAIKAVWSCL